MDFEGNIFQFSNTINGNKAVLELHENLNFDCPGIESFSFSQSMKNKDGGVYIFYAKEDFKINLFWFWLFSFNCSKINTYWKSKITNFKTLHLKEGQVFYIGSKKEYVKSRVRAHLITRKINGLSCLRLGRRNRRFVKKHLGLVIVQTPKEQETNEETRLRKQYLPLFSQK